jgi:hypothetical protein
MHIRTIVYIMLGTVAPVTFLKCKKRLLIKQKCIFYEAEPLKISLIFFYNIHKLLPTKTVDYRIIFHNRRNTSGIVRYKGIFSEIVVFRVSFQNCS